MLSVAFYYYYAECRYAEYRYGDCRYAECRGATETTENHKHFCFSLLLP
jgi:hypothetical protein